MSSYADAGVDVTAGDRFTATIAECVRATWGANVVGRFGSFAAGVTIPSGYDEPVIMMTTDGVGTKAELARTLGRFDGIGADLVAMCVDDLAALGAAPLGFTDYLAVGALDPERDEAIVASVAAACSEAGCALLGGETAIHPGVLEPAQFDVAGAAIGVVERSAIPDPASIAAGDAVIGVASPNVRSNGFSLVRTIFDAEDFASPVPGTNQTVGNALLEPSVLYVPAVLAVADRVDVHGFVHVTGGGIPGNLPRALPEGLGATIDTTAWEVPPIFDLIAQRGGVEPSEMLRTFNMGVGFILIVDPARREEVITVLADHDRPASVIGEIVPGDGVVLSS
ncbi:MAG: phosphoribosylformylglycinamidine cyclo-ligase [Gammaproteobacteria bacterium]|nr:phosphoribosylformylglycinamidine cyclo-ligase [Gammaproteobacteria bacterium]